MSEHDVKPTIQPAAIAESRRNRRPLRLSDGTTNVNDYGKDLLRQHYNKQSRHHAASGN
ncbi:MAG TPA: hypothetical protein VGA27_04090 [Candidatus Binatia bacterium]